MTYHKAVMLNANGEPDLEVMEDMAVGVNASGHSATMLDLTSTSAALMSASMSPQERERIVLSGVERLRDTCADLLMTCDYSGIDNFWVSGHSRAPLMLDLTGKPFLALFRKMPLFMRGPLSGLSLSPHCTLVLFSDEHDSVLRRKGFKRIAHVSPGTNPDRFRPMELSPEQIEKYGAEVSFVEVPPREDWWLYRSSLWSRKARKLWETVRDALTEDPAGNLYNLIEHHGREIKADTFSDFKLRNDYYPDFLLSLAHAADKCRHRRMTEALSDFDTVVFTSQSDAVDLAETRPAVDYRTELPMVYNAAKVNVGAIPAQSPSRIPHCVLDCAAAGRFIITGYSDELASEFKPEEELVMYRSYEELSDKVGYYLDHEQERQDKAEILRQRVLEHHTWAHSMGELLTSVMSKFDAAVA